MGALMLLLLFYYLWIIDINFILILSNVTILLSTR